MLKSFQLINIASAKIQIQLQGAGFSNKRERGPIKKFACKKPLLFKFTTFIFFLVAPLLLTRKFNTFSLTFRYVSVVWFIYNL